jgi:serine/threonine protein kinase
MAAGARQHRSEHSPHGKASLSTDHRELLAAGCEIGGRFRLERPLSSRGTVWLAKDEFGRPWAIKTAAPALIRHEARILSALDHPHIVRLEALAESGAAPVLVLEYLAGGDLVSLAGAAPVHWRRPLAELIEALVSLHAHGIVHRDLKARNVLLAADESVRLIDFGSATRTGSVWTDGGTTAAAVAPDRHGALVTPADDVYALAALIHELLFGAPPGTGGPPEPPPEIACPPERSTAAVAALAAAVADCLASRENAARMGLGRFRTVIESLRER